jgi:Leucine-rich repeat (LRR) protein
METMDEEFKIFLLENFDLNKDGIISVEEAALVKEIDCSNRGISSLEGIQHFTNLEKIDCSGNILITIDVSQNPALKQLICDNTNIQELDVSANPALELLSCKVDYSGSGLKSLKTNPELKILNISGHEISSLDFRGNKYLKELYCRGDQMINLDVSNSVLDSLDCRGIKLVALNIEGCTTLKSLNCTSTGNGFSTNLNDCLSLERLYISGLSDLDVSIFPLLKTLHYWNSFSFLDLTNNPELEDLRIAAPRYGEMGMIDLSNTYKLTYFSISFSLFLQNTPDMNFDLSNRKSLKSVSFSWDGGRGGETAYNTIKKMNLTGCTSLENIIINREMGVSGSIEHLDVSGCITLAELNINDMQMRELNSEGCTNLLNLNCSLNQLTQLNLKGCTNLVTLDCNYNLLTELDLNELTKLTDLICYYNPLISLKTNSKNLSTINCSYNTLTDIEINNGTGLKKIDCSSNSLISLNLTDCIALEELDCNYNSLLTTLDISDCKSLTTLSCSNCSLTTLDVSSCTKLTSLYCGWNRLQPSLDVSMCRELYAIDCSYNPDLTELILYRNHSIKTLNKDPHTQLVLAD